MNKEAELTVICGEDSRTLRLTRDDRDVCVSEILRRHGSPLNTRCGQRGLCDGCMVKVVSGQFDTKATSDEEGLLRACELKVSNSPGQDEKLQIELPARSLLGHQPSVLSDFRVFVPIAHAPLQERSDRPYGIAIDVGTTTVVVLLVRLEDGKTLGKASSFNRQMDYGDDVLTRINLCLNDASMAQTLRYSIIVDTIEPLIDEVLESSEVDRSDVGSCTLAGNTTMLHLLVGENPASLGYAPFDAVFLDHRQEEKLFERSEHLSAHLLPSAAAYIGADLVAGVFATGMNYDQGPSLLVDIGTNGEVIAKHGDKLIGCATAAGPAFEGSKLSCGMRAAEGAITHVAVDAQSLTFQIETISQGKPIGMCGSAYVDLLASLRAIGFLTATGRFDRSHPLANTGRVEQSECGSQLVIANGLGNKPVFISEADIVLLLQAKAAIAAGIVTLLEKLDLSQADIKQLYLAGGFGMHMSIENAITCGLLPSFKPHQIQLAGNTSLAGAYLALLDSGVIDQLTDISQRLETVELNLEPSFEDCYIDQLILA